MRLNIGENIARARRARNLTQEALAHMVGVSTPAVSKWETGASYPDIELLGPIARALKVNLDTLMDFTPRLTKAQAEALAAQAAEILREEGGEAAFLRMEAMLREWPGNPELAFYLAAVMLGTFAQGDPIRQTLRARAKALLRGVAEGDCPELTPNALYLLAGLCLADGETDEAEALLNRLPAALPDGQLLRAAIAERKGDLKTARKTLLSTLLSGFTQVETCLGKLTDERYSDPETALDLCRMHEQLAQTLDYPSLSDELFARVYLRMGDTENAAGRYLRLSQTFCARTRPLGGPFSELAMDEEKWKASLKTMRKATLAALEEDESLAPLRGHPLFDEAISLLRTAVDGEGEA